MFKPKEVKQSLAGVIADSFRLLNQTWAVNIIVLLVYYIIYLILQYIFNQDQLYYFFHPHNHAATIIEYSSSNGPGEETSIITSSKLMMLSHHSLVLMIVGSILTTWFYFIFNAILVRSCWNMATQGVARLGNAFKLGFKYFYVYFILMVIYFVIFLALAIIVELFNLIGLNWLTALVMIAAFCIYYYIWIQFALVSSLAVIEENGARAIKRSWNLVAGNWWRTLGSMVFSSTFYFLLLVLVGVGIFLAIVLPGALGDVLQHLHATIHGQYFPNWFLVLFIVDVVITGISIVFTVPTMYASNQVVLINDLRHRTTVLDRLKF